jgi:dTDP-4-amino-4,6-dideoxygalactose transaminase
VPENCEHPYHLFFLIMNSLEERTALINHLQKRNVNAIFHYQPLHLSSMGHRMGNQRENCPVAEAVSDGLLRLPFYNDLTEAEQSQVVAGVKSVGW